ncbi:hypothetical protein EMCRGX_G034594 [Ephydatia muelleri]
MESQSKNRTSLQSSTKNQEVVSKKIVIWPEWNEAEANLGHVAPKGKDKPKTPLPAAGGLFEDTDGVRLPPSLVATSWKRPSEYITGNQVPVIVENPDRTNLDLLTANSHLLHSQLICWVIGQLFALWRNRSIITQSTVKEEGALQTPKEWCPWDHIYPVPKGSNVPLYNASGKYCIKLHWMGVWRKITVDDRMPFDEANQMLLPRTCNANELWPAILTKGILKIAALDYGGTSQLSELGQCSVVTMLTGWVPEIHATRGAWGLLCGLLPLWKRPAQDGDSDQPDHESNTILMASSMAPHCFASRSLPEPHEMTEERVEAKGLPAQHVLVIQVRDEPLVPPPTEPPPPVLQAPFYLGLRHRQCRAGDPPPPPPPPPVEPQFVRVILPLQSADSNTIWMEYREFEQAYQSVVLFKKPSNYVQRHISTNLHLKVDTPNAVSSAPATGKKTVSLTSVKVESTEVPDILFVDSMEPIELLFVLSSLSNWLDGGKSMFAVSRPSLGPRTFLAGEKVHDQVGTDATAQECVVAGSLTVEPYSWRNVLPTPPVLKLTTSAVATATLSLPPGRHCLRLRLKAPVAYHLEVLSQTPFVLSTEEAVISHMSKESKRFQSHCRRLMEAVVSGIECGGEDVPEEKMQSLLEVHQALTQGQAKLLQASVVKMLQLQADRVGLSTDMLFAWKAYLAKLYGALIPSLKPSDQSELDHIATMIADIDHNEKLENEEAVGVLKESAKLLTQHLEEIGTAAFGHLMKTLPQLVDSLPFASDEKTRSYHQVYKGTSPTLQPSSWCILFREVFHMPEDQVLVPHLQCSLNTSLLRVIDNDTGVEVPSFFHCIQPHLYSKNKSGYTFVGEAWTHEKPSDEGSWLLRVVSSSPSGPQRSEGSGDVINTAYHTQEIKEYYLPDRDHHMFRFNLKVTKPCSISLHVCASKATAHLKVEVLDNEQSFYCTEGWGHCVIPVCNLHPSRLKTISEEGSTCDEEKSHKYVLEATVMNNTWPISDSAWNFVATQKSAEKLEDNKPSSGRKSKLKEKEKGSGGDKGAAGKKGATTPLPTARSSASQIDTTKPHWTLRIVTTTSDKEHLEVSKDTERVDELKSMVQAWEAEQPGRTKKGMESRQKFLESQGLSKNPGEGEDQSTVAPATSDVPTVGVPTSLRPALRELDLSPYITDHGMPESLLDEKELTLRQQQRQNTQQTYRTSRHNVMEMREAERQLRNQWKNKQLEMAERWQIEMDDLREQLNGPREAIRQRYLQEEQAKLEAEQAARVAEEEKAAAESKAKKKGGKK